LISLGSIPVIAFSALFFRSTRKTALPVFTLLIVAYLVTQEWNFRIVYDSLHILINIPLFGTAIGTALSLPGHFINLMAYTYLPLFAMGVLTIIHNSGKIFISTEKYQKSQRRSLSISMLHVTKKWKKAQVRVLISSFIIILLVSLAGWQAFSGSYYPMRAYPGSFLLGNSIEPKGVFSPTVINASVIKAYNIVVSNSSSGYNSVWIGGPSENDFAFAGVPNSVTENSLSYLVTNHLWYDVQPYLESHSVIHFWLGGSITTPGQIYSLTKAGFTKYIQKGVFLFMNCRKLITQYITQIFCLTRPVWMEKAPFFISCLAFSATILHFLSMVSKPALIILLIMLMS
jgi:hypothetical protein